VSNLIYLVIAVVLSVIGSLILWYRNRQPRSMDHGIRQFSKGLEALAPDRDQARERRSG
jgi:sensor domain CHASE-containing protein